MLLVFNMSQKKGAENKKIEETPIIPQYINMRPGYAECPQCHSWYNSCVVETCPRCKNPHKIDYRSTIDKYERK